MKLCCFSDLHYSGYREWLRELLENTIAGTCSKCDVAIIVGDVTGIGNLDHLREALELIKEYFDPLPLLIVPGNHDLYVSYEEQAKGINSLLKLSMFNELVEKLGYIALMKRPYVFANVVFVGSIGWYDYSFAPDYLNLPLDEL